jgi:uncharacterized protein YjiS (DUF1127 family)
MAHISFTDRAYAHSLLEWVAPAREGLRHRLAVWSQRRRERRNLAWLLERGDVLLDRDLRDLGLNRSQLDFEASKPFWRA